MSVTVNHTQVLTLDADRSVLTASGVVYGITFANQTASVVNVQCRNAADTADTLQVVIPADDTVEVAVPRHYNAGFLIKSTGQATVFATITTNSPAGSM